MSGPIGVDVDRLRPWLDDAGVGAGELEDLSLLGGGTQNILVRFRRGSEYFVLRRPPLHKRANSDETMRREARVLSALSETNVAHPQLLAACSDVEVLGAAFYIMKSVDGINPTVDLPPTYLQDPRWQHRLGLCVVDGAAAIGELDHVRLGLSDLGRASGYLERQIERWRSQLAGYIALPGYPGSLLHGIDEVGQWLAATQPQHWTPGLIHGDYHLANVLIKPETPELAAIVDWELTTIGDPLIDLGWLLATWPDPSRQSSGLIAGGPWNSLPSPSEVIEQYANTSHRDVSAWLWYEVFACYKLGIILEGTYARALAGQADVSTGNRLHTEALGLVHRALMRMAQP